ncbi:uncharacterized protein BYT42DRAFT_610582 [Radiomyces spectabilis]|uniref:uncharacterized protein n=1 Tax=Radiomyces spectabilis TaxID=64574 RepID=UPI0022211973|nr:uncharacterized protein BYT42DRAFT_610582 [Radiomyces spectabilis]KAI8391343.1 hypothetical protein BYT42DRAFT_610582 [Radiomyces spectabilis]
MSSVRAMASDGPGDADRRTDCGRREPSPSPTPCPQAVNDVSAACSVPSVCPLALSRATEDNVSADTCSAEKQKLVGAQPTVVVVPPLSACPKKREWTADGDDAPYEEPPKKKKRTLNKGKSVTLRPALDAQAEPLWLLQLRLGRPSRSHRGWSLHGRRDPTFPVVTATPLTGVPQASELQASTDRLCKVALSGVALGGE